MWTSPRIFRFKNSRSSPDAFASEKSCRTRSFFGLYLPESLHGFETVATQIVALAKQRDLRMGVSPKTKKPARHKDDLSKPVKKQKRPPLRRMR